MNSQETINKIKEWHKRLDDASNQSLDGVSSKIWDVISEMEDFLKYVPTNNDSVGGDTGTDADSGIELINDPADFREFLYDHVDEIRGLYNDKGYKNGEWNGLMDAINEVKSRYNVIVETNDWKDNEFEDIINEVF